MQTFSNAWLMHPALMDARVKLTICMEQMRVNQMWSHDLAQIWLKLRDLHEARPAMSEMLQLNEQRRRAYVNAAELHDVQRKLDDELTLRLHHLNKLAGRILEDGAGILEDEQSDGAQSRPRRQAFSLGGD